MKFKPEIPSVSEVDNQSAIFSWFQHYPNKTPGFFIELAESRPLVLILLINHIYIDPTLLVHALESLKYTKTTDALEPLMMNLFSHENTLIKEAALKGLEGHLADKEVFNIFCQISSRQIDFGSTSISDLATHILDKATKKKEDDAPRVVENDNEWIEKYHQLRS